MALCHSDLEVLFVFRQKGNNVEVGGGAVEKNVSVCFALTGQSPVSKLCSSSKNRVLDQKYSSGAEEFTAGMFLEVEIFFLCIGGSIGESIGEILQVITSISTAKVQFHD